MNRNFRYIGLILTAILITQTTLADGPPDPPGEKDFFITVFLEGLYDAPNSQMRKAMDYQGGNPVPRYLDVIADVITIELHAAGNYGTPVFTQQDVYLNQNGMAVAYVPGSGEYYLTIRHRNHIETVSATTINLETQDNYDFTDAAGKAYGSNQKQLASGVFGLYAGDVNQDGVLSGADLVAATDQVRLGANGYRVEDVNGDGVMSGADLVQITDNIRLGIASQTP